MIHSMKIFRYYCSSNSNHLVQIENWTRCEWTIFICTNTLWISKLQLYLYLTQWRLRYIAAPLKLFSSNRVQCDFNIELNFGLSWMILSMKSDLLQLQLKPFSSNENWTRCDVWTIFSTIQIHFELKIQSIYMYLIQQLKPFNSTENTECPYITSCSIFNLN